MPGSLDTSQRVLVDVDATGRPVGARLRDRLVLHGTGDYTFVVGGPFRDVQPGPETESEPGFQTDAILWRGFVVRRRVLDAVASMRVAETASSLPLRIQVRTSRTAVTLTVTNATVVAVKPFAGAAEPSSAAAALDRIRAALADGHELPAGALEVRGRPRPRTIRAIAPLQVEGELRAGGKRVRFRRTLGDGGPPTMRIALAVPPGSTAAPELRLVARPVRPQALLQPPSGLTWSALARRRRLDGAKLVRLALTGLLGAARSRQYDEFVFTPGTVGSRETVYSFRTRPAAAATRVVVSSGHEHGVLVRVALVAGIALAFGAAVAAWAHL